MTPEILGWFLRTRERGPITPGRTLEVGSQDVNGSVRQFFSDATEYIGVDMAAGKGVDLVLNASMILDHFGENSFDTVICCEMLEHDLDFMGTVCQIRKVLKPGGLLFLTTPTFGFPVHRYPRDYWRFGEDAYRESFLVGYTILSLEFVSDAAAARNHGTQPNCGIVSLSRKI